MRLKDRGEREKELNKIERDLKILKVETSPPLNVAQIVLGKEPPNTKAGKAIGDILITLLMPAVQKVQQAYDRDEQVQRNVQIAFSLAAYHRDHGNYPAKLDDLAPKYLAAVPEDLFSGKVPHLSPLGKGVFVLQRRRQRQGRRGAQDRRRPARRRPTRVHAAAGAETEAVTPRPAKTS